MITRPTIRFFVHPSTHEELDCSLVRPRKEVIATTKDKQYWWTVSMGSDFGSLRIGCMQGAHLTLVAFMFWHHFLVLREDQIDFWPQSVAALCSPFFFPLCASLFFFFFCLFGEDAEWNGGLKWFFFFFNREQRVTERETVWRDHRGLIEKQMRARPEDGRTGQEVAAECVCVTNESWGYTQNESADTHTFDCRRRYHQLQFHRLQSQGQYHRGCPDEKTQSGIVSTKTSIFPNNFKMTIMEFPLA